MHRSDGANRRRDSVPHLANDLGALANKAEHSEPDRPGHKRDAKKQTQRDGTQEGADQGTDAPYHNRVHPFGHVRPQDYQADDRQTDPSRDQIRNDFGLKTMMQIARVTAQIIRLSSQSLPDGPEREPWRSWRGRSLAACAGFLRRLRQLSGHLPLDPLHGAGTDAHDLRHLEDAVAGIQMQAD